jgi:transcription elongation factor Elf1
MVIEKEISFCCPECGHENEVEKEIDLEFDAGMNQEQETCKRCNHKFNVSFYVEIEVTITRIRAGEHDPSQLDLFADL